ncbi:MAG: hypothetical protein Q4B23_01560 [Helcococcus sp.]|nr:hypothetical protein [Helcococcus sp.]
MKLDSSSDPNNHSNQNKFIFNKKSNYMHYPKSPNLPNFIRRND